MAPKINGRALNYAFKVPDRGRAIHFFRTILGMMVLRHEEFPNGGADSYNGPYNNRWSKTMVGYGPEDTYFAIELTYIYSVREYDLGNDFIGITIKSSDILKRAKIHGWPILSGRILEAPGGYPFFIINEPQPTESDPILKVTLASCDLHRSIEFWNGAMLMKVLSRDDEDNKATLGYDNNKTFLEFQEVIGSVLRESAYGRISYSCPYKQLPLVSKRVKASCGSILSPLKPLENVGKITVRAIICADPDGHEIGVVDDESFRQMSQYRPNDEEILNNFIQKDESGQLEKEDDIRMKAQEEQSEL